MGQHLKFFGWFGFFIHQHKPNVQQSACIPQNSSTGSIEYSIFQGPFTEIAACYTLLS